MSSSFVVYFYCLLLIACGLAPVNVSLVGGRQDIDINGNERAQSALRYAVSQHNVNDNYVWQVSEVLRAQRQVVEGVLYIFNVIMARTNCTKESVKEVCTIYQDPEDAQAHECTFTVWSRPWINSTIVTEKC